MKTDWYNMIAKKKGGYKSNAIYEVEGISGEQVFEDKLIAVLKKSHNVLDAGCGDGNFTRKMSRYCQTLTGFDNAIELLNIAKRSVEQKPIDNLRFVYACTKEEPFPFEDEEFDLVYTRKGPKSIILHSNILKKGGTIFGLSCGQIEKVKKRLWNGDFTNIEIEVFDKTFLWFRDKEQFTEYISTIPGNPDFSLSENRKGLEKKLQDSWRNNQFVWQEYRYIWKAVKQK